MTKEDVVDLIKDAGYGVLATTEGTQPRVRPMMPYLEENGNFLIATFVSKRVVTQIQANPKVEMCFIDRKMNFVRIPCQARIKNDQTKKKIVWDNIPMLKQYFTGPQDSNFILIELETGSVEVMTPQQRVPTILSLK